MSPASNHSPHWIELRDAGGRLLGRYDPVRRLVHIRDRKRDTIFDLAMFDDKADPREG